MSELTIRMTNDDDQVSKLNQIDMLEQLHLFFDNRDVELAAFFRPELIDWARSCIDCSLPPDIWADRMHHIQLADDRGVELLNLRAEIETIKSEYDDEIETRNAATDEYNTNRDERIRGLEDKIEMLEHTNESLRGDLKMARVAAGEREQELRVRYLHISTLKQEVLELKGMLWDKLMEDMPK